MGSKMTQLFSVLFAIITLTGCSGQSGNETGGENDSVSTAPITDPSYNPKVEADSATKQMNLDSTLQKDSGAAR